jgi:hypothetical protein
MTAVEWLYERLERMIPRTALYDIDKKKYYEKAKEMEKEQIRKSYCDGELHFVSKQIRTSEQYYNETFKSNQND